MESTFMISSQAGTPPFLGTAFVMGRPFPNQTITPERPGKVRYVLITAAHVLDGIQGDTAIVYFRHNVAPGVWVPLPTPVPIRAGGHPLWTKNPNADVAVMYIRIPNAATMPNVLLSTDLLADDAQLSHFDIHPGDELFCLGFPFGERASAGYFPILRSGTIASFPLLPTSETKTFLFDFRVFKGNSGGPVYIAQSDRVYGGVVHLGESLHFIVGLVSEESIYNEQFVGQYSTEQHEYQLGLAVVI
ncbi:MAG: trypsin-like peptidase domain-containing protein, partial [Candidatus Acidiferrales bacterium]